MGISLTRKEFYELLWKEPQTALAKQFGVSDSAIGKAARKAEIPRPGPGCWKYRKYKHPFEPRSNQTTLKIAPLTSTSHLYIPRFRRTKPLEFRA